MQSICVYDTYNFPFLPIIVAFLIKLYASNKREINTIMISIIINNR